VTVETKLTQADPFPGNSLRADGLASTRDVRGMVENRNAAAGMTASPAKSNRRSEAKRCDAIAENENSPVVRQAAHVRIASGVDLCECW
jgi:hypothetical protein